MSRAIRSRFTMCIAIAALAFTARAASAQLACSFVVDADGGVGVDFPLGVPLVANGDTIVPLDVTLGFDALPLLGRTLIAAALEGTLPYRLDATIGVDAGMLGAPVFGSLTLLSGSLTIRP